MARDFLRKIAPYIFVTEPDPLKGMFPSPRQYGSLAARGAAVCVAQAALEFALYAGRVKHIWPLGLFGSDFVVFWVPALLSIIGYFWIMRRSCHPVVALPLSILAAAVGMALGIIVGSGLFGR